MLDWRSTRTRGNVAGAAHATPLHADNCAAEPRIVSIPDSKDRIRDVHVCVVLAVAAYADIPTPPTNITTNRTPSFSLGSEAAPPTVFNVQLRAENEPNGASTSESKGHAQVMVLADGTIEFTFTINNKSGETYTRAHIHKAPVGV